MKKRKSKEFDEYVNCLTQKSFGKSRENYPIRKKRLEMQLQKLNKLGMNAFVGKRRYIKNSMRGNHWSSVAHLLKCLIQCSIPLSMFFPNHLGIDFLRTKMTFTVLMILGVWIF